MRWSEYFLPTLREDPKDSEAISHKLMVRAGLIRRLGSGMYTYLPFGFKALQKAIAIVRDEMNKAGAQEMLMPALQPIDLWKKTGRDLVLGDVLIRLKDRTGKELALGPTHEEVVTETIKELRSHKQLPVTVYQIQTKFRDEPRPRFGVIRSKEFIMKDAYSFSYDADGLNKIYKSMFEAYTRIFERCGISVIACDADSGAMGGEVSHEFMAPSPNGEDRIVQCDSCGYAANLEAAKIQQPDSKSKSSEKAKKLEEIKTPNKHTVEDVSLFLKVNPSVLIKTLLYDTSNGTVAVLVCGDHDVNEAKLARLLRSAKLQLSSSSTIEKITKAPVGFTGPVGLKGIEIVSDFAVMDIVNGVSGGNKSDVHLLGVNPGRDFTPGKVADLRIITESDKCPECSKPLTFTTAIEIGHVFKLGTKYSEVFGANYQMPDKSSGPMLMGCYGIGINRILASCLEQCSDKNGIKWPVTLAPFEVVVTVMEASNKDQMQAGEKILDQLNKEGYDVLLDDRDQSPGSKLKDADLVGIPIQIIVGKVWQKEGVLEVRRRGTDIEENVVPKDLVSKVKNLLKK